MSNQVILHDKPLPSGPPTNAWARKVERFIRKLLREHKATEVRFFGVPAEQWIEAQRILGCGSFS